MVKLLLVIGAVLALTVYRTGKCVCSADIKFAAATPPRIWGFFETR